MERVVGFEPTRLAWQANMLPLNIIPAKSFHRMESFSMRCSMRLKYGASSQNRTDTKRLETSYATVKHHTR